MIVKPLRIALGTLGLLGLNALSPGVITQPTPHTGLLVHTMPWFQSKQVSGQWGWHWTMGHFDPDNSGPIASRYHPLIGPYDSGDPDVIELQVLWMKVAGFDGALIDWYGNQECLDYGVNHRNTLKLIAELQKRHMKFGLVYEDQTVPQLIKAGITDGAKATANGAKVLQWVDQHWMSLRSFVRIDGRPVFMVFGPQFYGDNAWKKMLSGLSSNPLFFTLHTTRPSADGCFDWPLPEGGFDPAMAKLNGFHAKVKDWKRAMPIAFPRFEDIYADAGVHASWGAIPDRDGKTYQETLRLAIKTKAPWVQVATWNDWGEGTQIEPSVEFGFRDLEATQKVRRGFNGAAFRFKAEDLRLPLELYKMRKTYPGRSKELDRIAELLSGGKPERARVEIKRLRSRSH